MGYLDLPDKEVDWAIVSKERLKELYDEIEELKAELAAVRGERIAA